MGPQQIFGYSMCSCCSLAHFHHLLNQGIPMPIQTGAQIPFLVVTYATIGKLYASVFLLFKWE